MAAEEQGLREEAVQQPFCASKGAKSLVGAAFDAAALLSKKSLKRLSLQRLLATYQQFKTSVFWKDFDCGLGTADGAMSLDHIDLLTSAEDASSLWDRFVCPATSQGDGCGLQVDTDVLKSLHHSVCISGDGLCKRAPCHGPACKFVSSMHYFIKEGASTTLISENI